MNPNELNRTQSDKPSVKSPFEKDTLINCPAKFGLTLQSIKESNQEPNENISENNINTEKIEEKSALYTEKTEKTSVLSPINSKAKIPIQFSASEELLILPFYQVNFS